MALFPGRFRRRLPLAALFAIALLALTGARWIVASYSVGALHKTEQRALHEGDCRFISLEPGLLLLVEQQAPSADIAASDAKPITRLVRLLGIEFKSGASPRGEPWSRVAAEFIERQTAGKSIRLKFDKRRVDRSNNWLAYVYTDDVLLNEQLVDAGLARACDYPGDSASIAKRLRGAEARARAAKRGLPSAGCQARHLGRRQLVTFSSRR